MLEIQEAIFIPADPIKLLYTFNSSLRKRKNEL